MKKLALLLLVCTSFTSAQNLDPSQVNGVNSLRFASTFAGADCGAKANAAFADLGSTPGQVWVDQGCTTGGTLGATAIAIPAGDTLLFTQGGTYTTSGGITLNDNSALASALPCAPNACPVTIRATSSAALPALVSVPGSQAVIHDLTLDGNASTLGTCGNYGGTVYSGSINNAVVNINGAGRAELERVQVQCGAGAGISIQSQNVDLSHLEVLFNMKQGLLCTHSADEWISGDSQFEANGFSGIELNGCGSVRVIHADVSTNGQSASATHLSTKCDIYIHGTAGHVANSNIFTTVQSGPLESSICDIGTSQTSYGNSFVGFQSLGSSPGGQPLLYFKDAESDLLEGTAQIGGATYGVDFEESGTGYSIPSTVRVNFAAPFSTANAWRDNVRYPDDFTGSIVGNTYNYYLGPFLACQNLTTSPSCGYSDNVSQFNNFGMFTFYEPNQQAGGYQSSLRIGKNGSNYNATELLFKNNTTGGSNNVASFGLVGGSDLTVDGSGNATAPGSMNAVSGYKFNGTAGFTGTKTAGSCVLTIQGGIITNVTGC